MKLSNEEEETPEDFSSAWWIGKQDYTLPAAS